MAEGWARAWVESERLQAERDDDRRLLGFLDSLLVLSVALDESAIISKDGHGKADASLNQTVCITCDGELCSNEPRVRKAVKSKAIKAMADDGVDISTFFPKSIYEVTPQILRHTRSNKTFKDQTRSSKSVDFTNTRLRDHILLNTEHIMMENESNPVEISQEYPMVDNLIVLCSCTNLKQKLADISKQTFDWDIDPPTDAAKAGEGDGAYVRVSREIRCKVDEFLSNLKNEAMATIK
jgi:hypothetical protein